MARPGCRAAPSKGPLGRGLRLGIFELTTRYHLRYGSQAVSFRGGVRGIIPGERIHPSGGAGPWPQALPPRPLRLLRPRRGGVPRSLGTHSICILESPDEGADPRPPGCPRAGPRPVRGLRRTPARVFPRRRTPRGRGGAANALRRLPGRLSTLLGREDVRVYRGGSGGDAPAPEEGKVRALGVSIHDRPRAGKLAEESILDLLMVRYNARTPAPRWRSSRTWPVAVRRHRLHGDGVAQAASRSRRLERKGPGGGRLLPVLPLEPARRRGALRAPDRAELRENLRAIDRGPLSRGRWRRCAPSGARSTVAHQDPLVTAAAREPARR